MNLNKAPQQIAEDISDRSNCRVKVGACLVDSKHRIFAVGWNHMGDGLGCCAERHAISRANPKRLKGASIFVWGKHRKTNNPIPAKPCPACEGLIIYYGIKTVHWNYKDKGWRQFNV